MIIPASAVDEEKRAQKVKTKWREILIIVHSKQRSNTEIRKRFCTFYVEKNDTSIATKEQSHNESRLYVNEPDHRDIYYNDKYVKMTRNT